MDYSSTGLVPEARPRVKTGLDVYLTALEQQNLLSTFGHFLRARHKKVTSLPLEVSMGSAS